jgi:hypothetical protein
MYPAGSFQSSQLPQSSSMNLNHHSNMINYPNVDTTNSSISNHLPLSSSSSTMDWEQNAKAMELMHYQNLIQRKVQELKLQSTSSPSLGEYSYPPTNNFHGSESIFECCFQLNVFVCYQYLYNLSRS